MKIFLSHSSSNKANVKAIINYMPKQVQTWLDENNLAWGVELNRTFENTIKSEVDYVIVFLSESRSNSVWVLKELHWALEYEKKIGRAFVLPVIMPSILGDPYAEFPEIEDIKYIKLDNYEETGFKSCAEKITSQLFSLIISDLDNMHKPKQEKMAKAILEANTFIEDVCKRIYTIIFRYRENNPLSIPELYAIYSKRYQEQLSYDDFIVLLGQVCGLLRGVYYDGYQIYLTEEHSQWKDTFSAEKKQRIAYEASKLIRTGQTIFIDAGSTMLKLVETLIQRIKSRTLNNIKIVTVSTEHANIFASACANMGYDQYTSPISLYIPGGVVRPNTKAIAEIDPSSGIQNLVGKLGKFDVAFIGANGAKSHLGIYTHSNEELITKEYVIANSKQIYFVMDDSKCGLVLESLIGTYDMPNMKLIINQNKENQDLQDMIAEHPDKIILAQ